MAAFAEMGVHPDLVSAIEEEGWLLPTPVQTEAIPLILGGGDVMVAAETGSGKTGAFVLPVLQVVHETLASPSKPLGPNEAQQCRLSIDDRDSFVALDSQGLRCQARDVKKWGGVRATTGIIAGKAYFEATVQDEGLCRIGWSSKSAVLDVGTSAGSFGYGGTGKKSSQQKFEDYGEPFGQDDVIGCLLDLTANHISYTKNGKALGMAHQIGRSLAGQALFPAVSMKNAELVLTFGAQPLLYPPSGFEAIDNCPQASKSSGAAQEQNSSTSRRSPTALILEPTRDLAEQTAKVVEHLQSNLTQPSLRSTLLVGGENPKPQAAAIAGGIDIVTGTPGRMMDMIESGTLKLDCVKFFVLDEADRLLDTGNLPTILRLFSAFPKSTSGPSRLQVLIFSATLHSDEVRDCAKRVCQNPILVDLKGKEAIPESVDHVIVKTDPQSDRSWLQQSPKVFTDNAHKFDSIGPQHQSRENWSEGVKRLKPRMLQRIIDTYKMDQCLIFCRTNFDCDNLEAFLNGLGGGQGYSGKMEKGKQNAYSCLVLAGQRSLHERREALQAFKDGDVRFLICTDVAARGLDISGLPYVINVTLPDRAEDYIHRVGRVGRVGRLGLAISLVSAVEEKVWYCTKKGYKPWLKPSKQDARTHEEGGHTIWQNELQMLKDVEERLKHPIQELSEDLSLPKEVHDRMTVADQTGQATYGEQKSSTVSKELLEHREHLRPAVAMLARLEREAQITFFDTQRFGFGSIQT